jgi:hypothetical protein
VIDHLIKYVGRPFAWFIKLKKKYVKCEGGNNVSFYGLSATGQISGEEDITHLHFSDFNILWDMCKASSHIQIKFCKEKAVADFLQIGKFEDTQHIRGFQSLGASLICSKLVIYL